MGEPKELLHRWATGLIALSLLSTGAVASEPGRHHFRGPGIGFGIRLKLGPRKEDSKKKPIIQLPRDEFQTADKRPFRILVTPGGGKLSGPGVGKKAKASRMEKRAKRKAKKNN